MTTYCDVNTCEDCPRYGDDCDGDKRVEHTDLISRADAIYELSRSSVYAWSIEQDQTAHNWALNIINALPSADAVSREDYHNLLMASNDIDRALREYQAKEETDAVDCTDFIEWLVDRVLDETIWENNSVAYGEIICRKLEKLGVLEVTEEPSYYIRPSADAVQGWISCSERLPEDGQGVIVTVDDNVYEIKVGSCIYSNGRFHSLYNDLTVIAWMPLPKPYKGGAE